MASLNTVIRAKVEEPLGSSANSSVLMKSGSLAMFLNAIFGEGAAFAERYAVLREALDRVPLDVVDSVYRLNGKRGLRTLLEQEGLVTPKKRERP